MQTKMMRHDVTTMKGRKTEYKKGRRGTRVAKETVEGD